MYKEVAQCQGCLEGVEFDATGSYHNYKGCGLVKCTSRRDAPRRMTLQFSLEKPTHCPFNYGSSGSEKCSLLHPYKQTVSNMAIRCPLPGSSGAHPCCPFKHGAEEVTIIPGGFPIRPVMRVHDTLAGPKIVETDFLGVLPLNCTIEQLLSRGEMSTRLRNAFNRECVDTVGQITQLTDLDLYRQKNTGMKTVIEAIVLARKYGINIKMESPIIMKALEEYDRKHTGDNHDYHASQ